MRNVEVSKDGKVIFVYPISIADISGAEASDQDYFDLAIDNALSDKLVAQSEVKNLRVRFVD